MATIKAIEQTSVHRIQSGQVIVDLCSVAKELVENGFDAGATTVEVRFKNQGLESIEVQDNGSGISPENYESLALKHYTSKLKSYSDLGSLQTFGFRGEALSSLCALSNFTVTTCLASDVPKGSKLEFEASGKLKNTSVVAAQKGTTVSVDRLFHNLPVRRKELERNVKREWGRVISLLNQYACIMTGVKFTVSHQPTKGKRIVLFSTKGNQTTRDNIINVFGAKTMTALIPLELKLNFEQTKGPVLQQISGRAERERTEVLVKGHVSRPASGEGRQTPDRQMFFVNGRPCGLPQFAKVFNEAYRAYNASQSPFIFANFQLDTDLYDVNVSPDKREILLHDQTKMLDSLREMLTARFDSNDYTVPVSLLSTAKFSAAKGASGSRQITPAPKDDEFERRSQSATVQEEDQVDENDEVIDDDDEESDEPARLFGRRTTTKSIRTKLVTTSGKAVARDSSNLNLITRWAERKSAARPGIEEPSRAHQTAGRIPESPTTQAAEDASEGSPIALQLEEGAMTTSRALNWLPEDTPQKVKDFHASLVRLESEGAFDKEGDAGDVADTTFPAEDPTEQAGIPAVATPSRVKDLPRLASGKSPLGRLPLTNATITIGDRTITTTIGSIPAKKPRVDDPFVKPELPKEQHGKDKEPTPSFGGRLSQLFAASASRSKVHPAAETEESNAEDEAASQDESEDREEFGGEEEEEEGEEEGDEGDAENVESQDEIEEEDSKDSEKETEDVAMRDASAYEVEDGSDEGVQDHVSGEHASEASGLSNFPSPEPESGDELLFVSQNAEKGGEIRTITGQAKGMQPNAEDEVSAETSKRAKGMNRGGSRKKDATFHYVQQLNVDEQSIRRQLEAWETSLEGNSTRTTRATLSANDISANDAEEKLSLTISKSDFNRMHIVGQFNLGFILAVRPAASRLLADSSSDLGKTTHDDDELFIIDQHATDEKYNFERLQATTVIQSQRLVAPKVLELTALEEEVVAANLAALEKNGFVVSIDDSGDSPVGNRCSLLALPLSREFTFSVQDLEELIALLGSSVHDRDGGCGGGGGGSSDNANWTTTDSDGIPRPSRVRRLLAMRACRASVMIGKPLNVAQMEKLVRHMAGLDKPWNCPHGRPTMRHLCGLGVWDAQGIGWREPELGEGCEDWGRYLKGKER